MSKRMNLTDTLAAFMESQAVTNASVATALTEIRRDVKALTVSVTPATPAKVTTTKPKAPAKAKPVVTREVRSASHTFLGERVGTGSKKLTKQNRKAFIAAHAWAKAGWSTAAIRSEVAAGAKVNTGWNVAI